MSLDHVLESQRAFLERYGDQVEQLLSISVYLVPVQEEDAADALGGFWSQVAYSVTDLFSIYRTALLRKPDDTPVALPVESMPLPATDAPLEITGETTGEVPSAVVPVQLRHLQRSYTLLSFLLRALKAVQVLIEMHAMRTGGPRRALSMCLRVEVVKLALKLTLRKRMPFSFYIDEDALEEVEPPKTGRRAAISNEVADEQPPPVLSTDTLEPMPEPSTDVIKDATGVVVHEAFVGRRSGRRLPAVGGGDCDRGEQGNATTATESTAAAVEAPSSLGLFADKSAVSQRLLLAEFLFHSRPFVHLMMLMRRGPRSWAAWWASLMMDRVALGLLVPELQPRPGTRAAALELAEMRRRRWLMVWALLRSPFFDKFLQRPMEALDRLIRKIPVLNIFNFVELFLALRPFYFTTSAS